MYPALTIALWILGMIPTIAFVARANSPHTLTRGALAGSIVAIAVWPVFVVWLGFSLFNAYINR